MSSPDDLLARVGAASARVRDVRLAVVRGDAVVASFGPPGAPLRLHRDAPIGRELAITHTASGTVLAVEVPDNFVVVAEVNDPRWVGVTGVELMRLAGRLGAQ